MDQFECRSGECVDQWLRAGMKCDAAEVIKPLEMGGRTHPGFADEEDFLFRIGQGEGSRFCLSWSISR